MVEVGIPIYKAKATLPAALDSLVAQTEKNFITCLSFDGDNEDYSDIINTYTQRGLNIRVINSLENRGPGIARQRILDTTNCEYILFLDADDLFTPRAIASLYTNIHLHNLDIVRSSFICEGDTTDKAELIPQNVDTVTWLHGKIYRVKYLKDNNIRFLPELRIDEDSYFNVIAWNATDRRGELAEVTYIWRNNPYSLTRASESEAYFKENFFYYIISQVEGLKKLAHFKREHNDFLITQTLINLYYYYQRAVFYKLPLQKVNDYLQSLKQEIWMQQYFCNGYNWQDIINLVKSGLIINDYVVFFEEPFNKWANRLLKN